jgi:hypothetical protein
VNVKLKVLGNLTQHSLIGTNFSEGHIAYMFRVGDYVLKIGAVCSFERLKDRVPATHPTESQI